MLGSPPLRDAGVFWHVDADHIPSAGGQEGQGCPRLVKMLSYSSSYILVLLGEVQSTSSMFSHCIIIVLYLEVLSSLCICFSCFFRLYLSIFPTFHILLLFVSFSCNDLIFPDLYSHISAQIKELNFLRETSSNLKLSFWFLKMDFPLLMAISLLPSNPVLEIGGNIRQTGLKRNILIKCCLSFEQQSKGVCVICYKKP